MPSSFYINRRPPEAVSANQTVSPPAATAAVSAPTPTVGITISPAQAQATVGSPIKSDWTPVANGAWLLADVNLTGSDVDWATREAQIGRSFAGWMKYKAVNTTSLADFAGNGEPFGSIAYPTVGSFTRATNAIYAINAGTHDANINTFATTVKGLGSQRIWLRLFWEFNLAGSTTNGAYNPANYTDAAGVAQPGEWDDFTNAWIRIWTIFFGDTAAYTALGIAGTPVQVSHSQVKFAYSPNKKGGTGPADPTLGYPGSRYVDWIMVDTYPNRSTGAGTEAMDSLSFLVTTPPIANTVDWYNTFKEYGKPMAVGESSVHPVDDSTAAYTSGITSPRTRVQWWTDALAALQASYPLIRMVTIFDANDSTWPTTGHTWKVDASSATTGDSGTQALAAFTTFATDTYINPSLAVTTGVPVPQLRVSPPAATASASSPVPGVQVQVAVGVASASASSPVPVLPVKAPSATASASASAPTMPIKVAGNTVILGYSNQSLVVEDIPTLERGIGRKFSGLRQNQQVSTATTWSFANSDFDAGHRPATYRSIQLNTGLYTDITSGVWDTNLTAIAQNLIASGRWSPSNPAIITFMHEVALSSNDFLGTAQQFIDAFRYIRNLFDSLGATVRSKDGRYIGGPAIFAYVGWNRMFTNGVVDSPVAGKSYADYDPDQGSSPAPAGTTYYTLVGSDPYNQIISGSLKYGTDAATMLDDIKAQAIARGKDWMLGEMGVADGPTSQNHLDKAAWLDSLHAYLAAIVPTASSGVCRYLFSTQEDGSLYNWDSSPDALAAGSRLALDPYFVQNSATAFGNTPVFGQVAPTATAAASALIPTVTAATGNQTVSPPAATAAASAVVPSVQLRVAPPVGAANASAPVPVPQLVVLAPVASASASALVPTASSAPIVSPPVAASSATSPLPVVQLRLAPAAASASASSPVASLQLRVSPLAASATAAAQIPVAQLRLSPPAASASASALVPGAQLRVVAAPAVVSASAPIPTVVSAVLPPPTSTAIHAYVTAGSRGRLRHVVSGGGGAVTVGSSASPAAGGAKGIVRI